MSNPVIVNTPRNLLEYNGTGNGASCETHFNHTAHGFQNRSQEDLAIATLRFVAEVYVSMPIAFLGIIGNLLSLVVLCYHRRMQKLHTILLQLQVLAVVDTLILVNGLLLRSFRLALPASDYYAWMHVAMFPWLYPIQFCLRMFGIWLTVLLTIDRYIAVWFPLDAKRLCTVNRTYLLMIIIAIGSVVFSLPRFFEYTNRNFTVCHRGFAATSLKNNKKYVYVYQTTLFTLMQYVIPTFVLVGLNTRVIMALRRSDTYRSSVIATQKVRRSLLDLNAEQQQQQQQQQQQPTSAPVSHQPINATFQSTRSVTIVVSAIVTMCITVHLVALISHVIWSSQTVAPKPSLEPISRHLTLASNLLVTLNSAVNFLIYCVFSRNFRSVLVRRFGFMNPVNMYRKRRGTVQSQSGNAQPCLLASCCCAMHRHRRHSGRGGTGDDTTGSKRSATLTNESRSSGTATRLSTMPIGCVTKMCDENACTGLK